MAPSGDLAYVYELTERFTREVVATESVTRDGVTIDYFTFRLTGRPGTRTD